MLVGTDSEFDGGGGGFKTPASEKKKHILFFNYNQNKLRNTSRQENFEGHSILNAIL